jgi:hypothetical protein
VKSLATQRSLGLIDPSVARECRQIMARLSDAERLILHGLSRGQYQFAGADEILHRELVRARSRDGETERQRDEETQ